MQGTEFQISVSETSPDLAGLTARAKPETRAANLLFRLTCNVVARRASSGQFSPYRDLRLI